MPNDNPPSAVKPDAQPPVGTSTSQSLDFDKAAYAGPAPTRTCVGCKQLIASEYYEVGGQVICSGCRDQLVGNTRDRWIFWRALLYGGGAAVAGTLLWSLIIYLTGYELGLIAIAVGIGVGIAVRKGSRGRGGWKYQTLAMVLTYLSITTSYVPMIVKGLSGQPTMPLPLALPVFAAIVWGLALAAPFLAGAKNIMGIIIIAIGLYEAWKYNRRLRVNGPFRLAPAAPALPAGTETP